METAIIIKAGLIILGILIMILSFYMNAVRKMTVNIAVVWELLGIALILVGAIPAFSRWCYRVGTGTAIAILILCLLILWGGFQVSILISSLTLKNQELAMQISLLNQENDKMMTQLLKLGEKGKPE